MRNWNYGLNWLAEFDGLSFEPTYEELKQQ